MQSHPVRTIRDYYISIVNPIVQPERSGDKEICQHICNNTRLVQTMHLPSFIFSRIFRGENHCVKIARCRVDALD